MGTDRIRAAGALAVEALWEWMRDRCDGLAAGMAFQAILGMPAFYALALLTSAELAGEEWTRTYVLPGVLGWLGPRGTVAVRELLFGSEHVSASTLTTLGIAGAFSLVAGASGYVLQLQDALEIIWGVRRSDAGLGNELRRRARGLAYAAGSAAVMVAGFLASGVTVGAWRARTSEASLHGVGLAAELALAFVVTWALATFWLSVLPPVRLTLRQILPWTAFMAALLVAGRAVVSLRAASQGGSEEIEVVEAIVVVLLWFLYSSMVLLYCAELMRLSLQRSGAPVSRRRGGRATPGEAAAVPAS